MEQQQFSPEGLLSALDSALHSLPYQIEVTLQALLLPFNVYQFVIAGVLGAFAFLASRFASPRMHAWLRAREGWPKWRLRALVVVQRRLGLIFYVLFLWIAYVVMRHAALFYWSWILGILARLTSAWLIVVFATRLIVNPTLRTIVRYGAWIWLTLSILNMTAPTQQLLDSIAISVGDVRLSVWTVLKALVLLVVLVSGARFSAVFLARKIRGNEDISPSVQVLAVKVVQVLLYGAAFFLGLKAVGVDLTGLAVLSGAIGIGVGFGLQKVVSNLVSGLIILLDKSIKPGDVISLGETFGWVESLGARYVSITTRDGKEYLIPNEDLITGQVVNWSYSNKFVRLDIHFGTSYADDPHLVRRLAVEAAAGCQRVLRHRPPVCHIVGFGESSVDYILRFWITDPAGGLTNIRGNVFLALWDTFKENGIRIPFPQREVRLLGETAAAAGDPGADATPEAS